MLSHFRENWCFWHEGVGGRAGCLPGVSGGAPCYGQDLLGSLGEGVRGPSWGGDVCPAVHPELAPSCAGETGAVLGTEKNVLVGR